MNIFEKMGFNNVEMGNLQSIAGMSMIPIVGDNLTKKISSPEEISFKGTTTYGSMKFENVSDEEIAIMPSHTTAITKERAQDHCTSKPIILPPKSKKTVTDCCCIQDCQGGSIYDLDIIQYDVLPLGLRHELNYLNKRNKKAYNKLWENIKDWKYGFAGSARDGRLNNVFEENKEALNTFVAQFENVKNQLGAFVFFNDRLAGIEIMPTHNHWKYFWKRLIRGCYGLERLRLAKLGKLPMQQIKYIPGDSDNLLEDVNKNLNNVKNNLINKTNIIIDKFVQTEELGNIVNLMSYNDKGQPLGDIIKQEKNSIYASLCILQSV